MNELLDKCRIGYRFGKITPDKRYWLCCGGVSSIGSWDKDGTFKEFWKSQKYQDVRDVLQNDYEMFEEIEACRYCPHYFVEKNWDDHYGHINTDGNPKQGPREFQFEIGNPCNHRCDFCWHWSKSLLENGHPYEDWKDWSKQIIEWDIFKSIIDDLHELGGCELISISGGGEPFVIKDMMKRLEYIKSKGFQIKLFTNFSIISKKDVKKIVEIGVDEIHINISAGKKETYSELRGIKEKEWDDLLMRLSWLKEYKNNNKLPLVRNLIILTNTNIEEVEEMFIMSNRMKLDSIYFRVMTPHELYNKLLPTKKQINKFINKVPIMSKKYNVDYWNELEHTRS